MSAVRVFWIIWCCFWAMFWLLTGFFTFMLGWFGVPLALAAILIPIGETPKQIRNPPPNWPPSLPPGYH